MTGAFFRFRALEARKSIFLCQKWLKSAFLTKSKGFPSQMFSLWVKFGTLSKNFFDFLTTKNKFSRKIPIIKVVRNGLNYKSGNLFFEKEILRNILDLESRKSPFFSRITVKTQNILHVKNWVFHGPKFFFSKYIVI